MRAVVLDGPGGVEALRIREVPLPAPEPGWVRIRVEAFGINRSEQHLRAGLATGATFPIVPGIEAVGTVDLAPGGEFEPGEVVVAMMGGMGRAFDGGYAEYTSVPAVNVIPVRTTLDWATLGALPEMLQTAHGSLYVGVDIQPGQTQLVRGGTSSVGVAAAVLAKERGLTVLSTTRNPGAAGHAVWARRRSPAAGRRGDRRQGPRDLPGRRPRCAGARPHQRPARHPAGHRGPRHGVLHRHAQRPVDDAGLLPNGT